MSKLSQLKQEAYQAGKKRDWDLAVSIYEQILEVDKNNPMVINEMGDLCLKTGETPRAIRQFLSAASRYRATGLLNNAVAIYKKILRYDADNQNAHWYLAETRASQGLLVEGQEHALRFLENSERVTAEIKEIFLKRCGQLFELYASSCPVLEKLLPIYRTWDLHLEAARVRCLLGCFAFETGETETAREVLIETAQKNPEVQNYPEYQRLNLLLDPAAAQRSRPSVDVHSLDLDAPAPQPTPAPAAAASVETTAAPIATESDHSLIDLDRPDESVQVDEAPVREDVPTIEIPVGPPADETSFASVADEIRGEEENPADEPLIEIDEDGCFDLSLDGEGGSFEDLVAQAASNIDIEENPAPAQEDLSFDFNGEASLNLSSAEQEAEHDPLGIPIVDEEPSAPAEPSEPVDLLAEILSSDSGPSCDHDGSQVAAITSDIGAQVGGGEQDAGSLYEMGLVYLDMGLFDQAVESFEKAAEDADFVSRSLEMAGITLLKAQRATDAIATLQRGREQTISGSREHLGMMYHLAQAHEQNHQENEALELYQQICDADSGFLDVRDRLAQLSNA